MDGWKNPDGAVVLNGPPVVLFDCVFTHPPTKDAPVRVTAHPPSEKLDCVGATAGQRLILANNTAEGCNELVQTLGDTKVYEVPRGAIGAQLTSAAQTFLKSRVRIPGKVFDVKRDFGAKGDGVTDDTVAIKHAIAAAQAYGKGAIAYLPSGRFVVSETLLLTGSDYFVGGSGYGTALLWQGQAGGTTVEIRDPDHLTLENIAIGHHDNGVGKQCHRHYANRHRQTVVHVLRLRVGVGDV